MSDPQITIRPAGLSDLPALNHLEQDSFAVPWSEESLRHDLAGHPEARYLAACAPDGQLVGYAAYWRTVDEGMITNIAVAAAWRCHGIGRRLLDSLVRQAFAERLSLLSLEVRPSNLAARHLYESAGFSAVGIRHGYYADNGEDAVIMTKNLSKI